MLIGSWSKTTFRAGGSASTSEGRSTVHGNHRSGGGSEHDSQSAHLRSCVRSFTIEFAGEGSGRNRIVHSANQETLVDPLTGGLGVARVAPA
jgi:hypothetical protein